MGIALQVMPYERKPEWLKIRPPTTEKFLHVKETLRGLKLNTVCEEAHCPNISECWSGGTATFMVLGSVCTRGCRFCAVPKAAKGEVLDEKEPENLAKAVTEWKLDYVVITSVDRDDLEDQGAGHFAECVRHLKQARPDVLVEVLIPDFRGNAELLQKIVDSKPDVIAHNVETVKRLQRKARDGRANYGQSLGVLENVKKMNPEIYTKSSLMLGIGEREEEVLECMDDLRKISVDVLTLGQYLRPSARHLEIDEYVAPEKFDWYKAKAEEKGFLYCAAGPFVRSSYKAGELFLKNTIRKQRRI